MEVIRFERIIFLEFYIYEVEANYSFTSNNFFASSNTLSPLVTQITERSDDTPE